jgi:hypothetical protein
MATILVRNLDAAVAERLRLQRPLVAPDVLPTEIANALWKKSAGGTWLWRTSSRAL